MVFRNAGDFGIRCPGIARRETRCRRPRIGRSMISGFTLVELLVVIAIIGILVA